MKRQALGRGLGALIPEKTKLDPLTSAADIRSIAEHGSTAPGEQGLTAASSSLPGQGVAAETGNGALQWIDIDRIRPSPLQPRKQFLEERIEELAASIRSSGILQPVIVRKTEGGFSLVAGERRWRAAQRAGLLRLPALVREIPDDQLLVTALIENLQREDLNPMEEARAYSSLMQDFGLTQAEVAERVGRQRPTVANSLRLLALSPKVQKLVESGTLSMGHAKALVSLPNHKAQEFGANHVASGGLSVRETEVWVSRHTDDPEEPKKSSPRDPNVGAAELNLQRHLGTRVRILPGRGEKGRILIDYYSAPELDRLYERLSKS